MKKTTLINLSYHLEYIFLIAYFFLGVMNLFTMPIFSVPDEGAHFFRAYEISKGEMISVCENTSDGMKIAGAYLPQNLYTVKTPLQKIKWHDLEEVWHEKENPSQKHFYEFSNTALYSPTNYIPQALGIFITRNITAYSLLIAYGGRIANWLFIGICLFFAIKIIPYYKLLLFILAFIPMNLHEFNSLAPDGIVFSISILFFSVILNIRNKGIYITKKEQITLWILTVFIGLTKMVYVPFIFAIFLIPRKCFKSYKEYVEYMLLILLTAIGVNLSWLIAASQILSLTPPKQSNPVAQTTFILHHIFTYIKTVYHTYTQSGISLFWQMMGHQLSWLNVTISNNLLSCYVIITVLTIIHDAQNKMKTSPKERGLLLAIVLLIITLITTALYIQWTPLQKNRVEGLQGRYFLPLLFPFLISILPKKTISIFYGVNSELFLILSAIIIDIVVFIKLGMHFFMY